VFTILVFWAAAPERTGVRVLLLVKRNAIPDTMQYTAASPTLTLAEETPIRSIV
jgi:hypothetical protein